jgi:hypothetical protein
MAVASSLGYGLWNFFTSMKPGSEFEPKRLIVTIIFSLIIAFLAIVTGVNVPDLNWETIGTLFVAYAGILVYLNKGVDAFWLWKFGAKLGSGDGTVPETRAT